jgi:pimeloyl-ACP methyl ester carboxylesterase
MTHAGSTPVRVQLCSGVDLHYVERGHGQPLLLLHGGMGDCGSWGAQISAFAKRYRVIAYSRRYSSPNSNPDPAAGHSAEIDADDLSAFVSLLQIGPAHVVATSYGALVALLHALRPPGQVLSLVLAEPPLHRWVCRTPAGASLYAAFMNDVWLPGAQAFMRGDDRRALQLLFDGMWGRPIFELLSPPRSQAALRNAGAMRALTQSLDPFPDIPRAAVARLAMPVLLLHGEQSSALHVCVIEELAAVLPRASRAVIARAGHGSPVENPQGFNDAVLRFLSAQAHSAAPLRQKTLRSDTVAKGRAPGSAAQ